MLLSRSLGFWVGHSDFSLHSLSIQFIQQQQMNVTHSGSFFADNLFKLFPNLENLLFKVHFFSKIPTKLPKQLNTDHSLITSKTWTRTTTWPTHRSWARQNRSLRTLDSWYLQSHFTLQNASFGMSHNSPEENKTVLCKWLRKRLLADLLVTLSLSSDCKQSERLNFSRIAREKNSKVGYQSPHMRYISSNADSWLSNSQTFDFGF